MGNMVEQATTQPFLGSMFRENFRGPSDIQATEPKKLKDSRNWTSHGELTRSPLSYWHAS